MVKSTIQLVASLWVLAAGSTTAVSSPRKLKAAKKKMNRAKKAKKKGEMMTQQPLKPTQMYKAFFRKLLETVDFNGSYFQDPCGTAGRCGGWCVQEENVGRCDGAGNCLTEKQEWVDGGWVPCEESETSGAGGRKTATAGPQDENDRRGLFTWQDPNWATYFDFCADVYNFVPSPIDREDLSVLAVAYCANKYPIPSVCYVSDPTLSEIAECTTTGATNYNSQQSCYANIMFQYPNAISDIELVCDNANTCPNNAWCECESPDDPNDNAILCAYQVDIPDTGSISSITVPCKPYYNNGADKVWCGGYCVSSDAFPIDQYTDLCGPELV